MSVILVTIVIAFVVYWFYLTHLTKVARRINQFPGGVIWPLFGNVSLSARFFGIQGFLTSYIKRHGAQCYFWSFNKPQLLVSNASGFAKILSCSTLIEKGGFYEDLRPDLGDGLLTAPANKWRRDRKLLNEAFRRERFEGCLSISNKKSLTLMTKLSTMLNSSSPKNILPLISNFFLEVTVESAIGVDFDTEVDQTAKDFEKALELAVQIGQVRLFTPWIMRLPFFELTSFAKRVKEAKVLAQNFTLKTMQAIKEQRKLTFGDDEASLGNDDGKPRAKPVMDILLDGNFSDKECVDHIVTIILGGTETTAASINTTLFYLALYPEYQQKCREEIDAVFSSQGELTMAAMSELTFVEMCWKESCRIFPPVPFVGRQLLHDVELDHGLVAPKGCNVLMPIYDLHRDSEMFPDPDTFDPFRFEQHNASIRPPHAYLPFGSGIRNCIGFRFAIIEAKVLLAHMLANFYISTTQVAEDFKIVYGVVSSTKKPVNLILKKRTKIC